MADRSETFALESLMQHARCREAGDVMGASVALLRVRALATAKMWEAADQTTYNDLEFLADDMVEQTQLISLAALDAVILGEQGRAKPVFDGPATPLSAAQVLAGPLAKAQVEGDAEFACKNSLVRPAGPVSPVQPQRPAGWATAQADTPPDMCCGFPLSEHVTQNGENRGRLYRKCDVCAKWLGFVDDKPARRSNARGGGEDDEDGAIRPARAGLGQATRRSGSGGRSRQIKYPGPAGSNRGGSEEDSPALQHPSQQQQQQGNAPDFQLASKRLKSDPGGGGGSGGGNGGSNGGGGSSNSDRGSRSFNPARSVVDAINATDTGSGGGNKRKAFAGPARKGEEKKEVKKEYDDPIYEDERLKTIDPAHVENILSEIMDGGQTVTWEDIAGLEFAKNSIKEMVVWPMLRPDIFTGLRAAPKGLLLFGPPGTGKTMIGKAIAHEAKATFFAISASILTSKWIGEGEKMVRALFAVARIKQPSVIFIDEIDSLLTARSDNENEATRRIKTEFLVQLDGVANGAEERLLLVGATNRPQELDEAARRRLTKRLYIPLPEPAARRGLTRHLLRDQLHSLSDADLDRVTELSEGYSGADIKVAFFCDCFGFCLLIAVVQVLCSEASMGPIRDLPDIMNASKSQVRSINMQDFERALRSVRASVAPSEITAYLEWNSTFGTVKG